MTFLDALTRAQCFRNPARIYGSMEKRQHGNARFRRSTTALSSSRLEDVKKWGRLHVLIILKTSKSKYAPSEFSKCANSTYFFRFFSRVRSSFIDIVGSFLLSSINFQKLEEV